MFEDNFMDFQEITDNTVNQQLSETDRTDSFPPSRKVPSIDVNAVIEEYSDKNTTASISDVKEKTLKKKEN